MSLRTWAVRVPELLDDPAADTATVVSSLHDIARINRYFGNAAVAARCCRELWAGAPAGTRLSLLDIGTGLGDIPRAVANRARADGVTLDLFGVERHVAAARAAAGADLRSLLADGMRLPFRDGAFDIVLCAKLLHHLPGERGVTLVREMARVAGRGGVLLDLRRSPVAAFGIWLASFPMRFQPATRRDAFISVYRGFTDDELGAVCRAAGVAATIRRHMGYCLTATWSTRGTPDA